ncbi:serine protease [Streptomyces sp. B21-104]|uniref:S1 family peptidase n=1 Tax=Streptomyces sp. B21-104 TaxID=3039421 RepID=UPI0030D3C74D
MRAGKQGAVPVRFCGTGFVLPGGLLITCRHCIEPISIEPDYYAGAIELPSGRYQAEPLHNLCFESSGMDIAAASVESSGSTLMLGIGVPGIGQDVGTFGYAGTYGRLPPGAVFGNLSFDQQERWLQGYVTRAFNYELPTGERRPSWEVDMPTPGGMSGAPLFQMRQGPMGRGVVIGMCYGRYLAHGDADTSGITLPGYVFGLAHYYTSLRDARFEILGQASLGNYLAGHGAILEIREDE